LYDCSCGNCKTHQKEQLNLGFKDEFKQLLNIAESAFKRMHKNGGYKTNDLKKIPEYKTLIKQTQNSIAFALQDNVLSDDMLDNFNNDIFLFSALKTHAQLSEASKLLLTEDKQIKSFNLFKNDIDSIKKNYNSNYLEAEYEYAVSAVQTAERWQHFSDSDRYMLQYRTAEDDRVRVSHEVLNNTTLSKADPFWSLYTPPNGWRCRCTVQQVLKRKYKESDSVNALQNGEKATTKIGKKDVNKLAIFRFNPAIKKVIFPPSHPYNKMIGATAAKKVAKELIKENTDDIADVEQLNTYFEGFAKDKPYYFQRGFKKIFITRKSGVNGSTDMNGKIRLKESILKDVIEGISSIKKGGKTTLAQETALSTMHHELMHNANKVGNTHLTKLGTRYMELANEFVSRKKLPGFFKDLGGELQNKELTNNRTNTGYNRMVRNFDMIVKEVGADKAKVLKDVESYLINENYKTQKNGLIKAITNNSAVKTKTAATLIVGAVRYSEVGFKNFIKDNLK
jgi:SPP1 gp7 family putative phage head morphogenesis protein